MINHCLWGSLTYTGEKGRKHGRMYTGESEKSLITIEDTPKT